MSEHQADTKAQAIRGFVIVAVPFWVMAAWAVQIAFSAFGHPWWWMGVLMLALAAMIVPLPFLALRHWWPARH